MADADYLRYKSLGDFDKSMIHLFADNNILKYKIVSLRQDEEKKILIFTRGAFLFVFSFNPEHSFENYCFEAPAGKWVPILDSDAPEFGGFGRNDAGESIYPYRRQTAKLIYHVGSALV